jgi:hypothetical protein
VFQNKIAFGKSGMPWSLGQREVKYNKGICPNAEELHEKTYIGFGISGLKLNDKDIRKIANTFEKVWANLDVLESRLS